MKTGDTLIKERLLSDVETKNAAPLPLVSLSRKVCFWCVYICESLYVSLSKSVCMYISESVSFSLFWSESNLSLSTQSVVVERKGKG
ncbi:hypothetical protein Hanom_Chr12g01074431 [Helianthus anomalus]